MDVKVYVLHEGMTFDLSGLYFVPVSLLYLGELNSASISLVKRDGYEQSFTRYVYDKIFPNCIELGEIPLFALFNQKTDEIDVFLKGDANLVSFKTYDGKQIDLKLDEVNLKKPEWDMYLGYEYLAIRSLVAKMIRLSQKKVIHININTDDSGVTM